MGSDDNITNGEMEYSDKENIRKEEDPSTSPQERMHGADQSKSTHPVDCTIQDRYIRQIDAILATMPGAEPPRRTGPSPLQETSPTAQLPSKVDTDSVAAKSEAPAVRDLDTPKPNGTIEDEVKISVDIPRHQGNEDIESSTVDITNPSLEESMYEKWRCCRCGKINSANKDPEVCSNPGCLHYNAFCTRCQKVEEAK